MVDMAEYVEIAEATGPDACNAYLRHGYHLIGAQGVSGSATHKDTKTYYVRRRVHYIMGRTADVEHYEPDKRQRVPVNPVTNEI